MIIPLRNIQSPLDDFTTSYDKIITTTGNNVTVRCQNSLPDHNTSLKRIAKSD
jgi:hypothetical protein